MVMLDQADINLGITLQHANYAFFAIVGVWLYDFVLTACEEVEFILNAQWQSAKFLYLVCRYLPFSVVFIDIFRIVQPGLSLKSCMTCHSLNGYVGGIALLCAEALFVLRIWVLSDRKRRTLIVMLCNYVLFLIAILAIVQMYDSSSIVFQSPIPQVASCYSHTEGHIIVFAFALLLIGELEILVFMLYRSWKLYRELGNNLPLVRILMRHNVLYFVCGLFFSTTVIITMITLPASFGDLVSDAQILMFGILSTRMHRELWNAAHHRRLGASSPTNVSHVPLAVFSGASPGDT
ncbi:hypothetical protein M405DRAFT_860577 [Rhizopogon salebrosus TDB-379]|nr:hypothetical protein M405DRAFT_860577 [Rhizopogon salebrosus TDB-379]